MDRQPWKNNKPDESTRSCLETNILLLFPQQEIRSDKVKDFVFSSENVYQKQPHRKGVKYCPWWIGAGPANYNVTPGVEKLFVSEVRMSFQIYQTGQLNRECWCELI